MVTIARPISQTERDALAMLAPGSVVYEGDAGYAAARFKGPSGGLHSDYPAAVAHPTNVEEVSKILKFAVRSAQTRIACLLF